MAKRNLLPLNGLRAFEAAARLGSLAAAAGELGVTGGAVSQVFIGERHYNTAIRFSADARSSPEAIGRLLLTSSTVRQPSPS